MVRRQLRKVPGRMPRTLARIPFTYYSVGNVEPFVAHIWRLTNTTSDEREIHERWEGNPIGFESFKIRLAAAAAHGFIIRNDGHVSLTPLGERLMSENEEVRSEARREGFLHVPLNQALFQSRAGESLAPYDDLEEEIKRLGVPQLQAEKARQAFMKSAREVGYLSADSDVLAPSSRNPVAPTDGANDARGEVITLPAVSTVGSVPPPERDNSPRSPDAIVEGSDMSANPVDPLIAQVLREIPKENQPFSEEEWDDWFSMFSETYKWAKRRARQRMVQSLHGNGRKEA